MKSEELYPLLVYLERINFCDAGLLTGSCLLYMQSMETVVGPPTFLLDEEMHWTIRLSNYGTKSLVTIYSR